MSNANPILDPIGYRCDGCGRLFRDPYADLSAIRAAGGRSCCPERKPIGLSDRIEELEANLAKAVEEAEKYQYAFAAQSRKLQAVLHIDGVRAALEELKGQDDAVLHGD